jgi:ATP-dependent Clp endopeptidase proteolytic subunit ClpP
VPETPGLPVPTYRYWGQRKPPKNRADVWNVTTARASDATSAAPSTTLVATLRLYGPIDSWGGFWGVSAKDVSAALDELPDSVSEIRVRINSPGGEVHEGMAILNMLRSHKAKVVAIVDGLAASAASFLAVGCDETVMSPGTQLMVHDASGFCFGQASDMRKQAEALDSVSDSIAAIYAEAAGGKDAEWRDVMREENWYTAAEAVEVGLADRAAVVRDEGETSTAGAPESEPCEFEDRVAARFDLSIFNYAGRGNAPAPHKPPSASPRSGNHNTEGGPAVAFSDAQLTTMRTKLELPETADEAAIVAAINAVVDDSLGDVGTPAPPAAAPAAPVATAPAAPAAPAASPATPIPGSTMVIETSAWDQQQERIKRLEAADNKRRRDERDQVIATAVNEGKFAAKRKDHWVRVWDADPEGTRQVIDGLTKGVVPVNELGHAGDDGDFEDELAHLYGPPAVTTNGA